MGTFFLFARPSFLTGLARSLDIFGTFNEYNSHLLAEDADMAALAADWEAVGDDLEAALEAFRHKVEEMRLPVQSMLPDSVDQHREA